MRVRLEGVDVRIDGVTIVDGVDLVAESGQMIGLVGPNGSGKSTMLRTIYRALRPAAGAVHLDDDDVWKLSARQSAQRSAVVAQEAPADFDLTVSEVVMMGRTPHKGLLDGTPRRTPGSSPTPSSGWRWPSSPTGSSPRSAGGRSSARSSPGPWPSRAERSSWTRPPTT